MNNPFLYAAPARKAKPFVPCELPPLEDTLTNSPIDYTLRVLIACTQKVEPPPVWRSGNQYKRPDVVSPWFTMAVGDFHISTDYEGRTEANAARTHGAVTGKRFRVKRELTPNGMNYQLRITRII